MDKLFITDTTDFSAENIKSKLPSDEERAIFDSLVSEELEDCIDVIGVGCKKDDGKLSFSYHISYDREKAANYAKGRPLDFFIEKELKKIFIPSGAIDKSGILKACKTLMEFFHDEYDLMPDATSFKDLTKVSIAYTTVGENEKELNVYANLLDPAITKEVDGREFECTRYNSIEEMINEELNCLDFDELAAIDDEDLEIWEENLD